jgi:tetratricopeptide (TPR) repeat protein
MELIEGINFDHILASQLSLPHKTHLLSQVVDALAFVHARGILHRDIKPDNVLVLRDKSGALQVKITDFGLAGIFDQQGASEDSFKPADDHWVMGTPHYMAPERIDGFVPVGPASDLYSVGVMLYRMVSGDLPFPQASLRGMYQKQTSEAPRLHPREGITVPRALIDVTQRLMLMDPNLRYRVAADVLADLEPHRSASPISPDEWIALAPTTLNLTFSSDETLNHSNHTSLDNVDLTVALAENPALWGRNQLRAALEALAETVESGTGQVGVMLSVPGAGAAEMLQTFSTASAQTGRFTVLSGTFQAIAGRPSGLRQALEEHLRTEELDAFLLRRLLWRQRRQLGLSDEIELEALLRFLRPHGGDTVPPDNQQNRLFALFVRVLRALAEERPVMLALEGLGEGGELSAAFIEFISFELSFAPFPLFVLCSSGLLNSHQDFALRFAGTDRYEGSVRHCLEIAPLDGSVLAGHLARSFGLAPESALRLAEEAGGLPMLAAELAELTAARMNDTDMSERSTALEVGSVGPLTSSLIELLLRTMHERLARHQDAEVLEALLLGVAVLGDEVSLDLLEELLADQLSPEQFDDHVDTLMGLKLLQDRGDLGQRRVRLQPSVLRRALLEQEGRDHRDLHRSAAKVRGSQAGAQALGEAGAIGDHLEAAGDLSDACDHWLQAADFETQHGDALRGAEWGLKALASLDSEDPRRSPLAIRLGRTLLDAGSAERAEEVLAEIVVNGAADEALFAGEVLADLHENHGASLAWKELIEALETKEAEASPAGRRAFLRSRSMWLNSYGRSQDAREDAEEALREAEPGPETQRAAQRLVYCCLSAGRLEEAELAARTALEHSSEQADLRVRSLRALGVVLSWRGRPEEGSEAQNEALELCRSRGLIARVPRPGRCLEAEREARRGRPGLRASHPKRSRT